MNELIEALLIGIVFAPFLVLVVMAIILARNKLP